MNSPQNDSSWICWKCTFVNDYSTQKSCQMCLNSCPNIEKMNQDIIKQIMIEQEFENKLLQNKTRINIYSDSDSDSDSNIPNKQKQKRNMNKKKRKLIHPDIKIKHKKHKKQRVNNFNGIPQELIGSTQISTDAKCSLRYDNVPDKYKNAVSNLFYDSLDQDKVDIIGIQRVQSLENWESYCLKKKQLTTKIDNQNKNKNKNESKKVNEKWLWHGTNPKTVDKIVHQGFLRQFQRISAFGKGTYFARHSQYSSDPSYSSIDTGGIQHMFLCRVLVGEFHKGKPSLLQPNLKPGSKFDVYETTVNNIRNPTIFVTYQDNQAFPEFLVSFKMK